MKKSLNPGIVVHNVDPNIPDTEPCGSLSQGQSTEQVLGQPSLSSDGVGKEKAGDNVIEQGSHVPTPASSSTQQLQPCSSGFRVNIAGTAGTIDAG